MNTPYKVEDNVEFELLSNIVIGMSYMIHKCCMYKIKGRGAHDTKQIHQ